MGAFRVRSKSSGEVEYACAIFPIESIQKNAFEAEEAAHCVDEQGKFRKMHDRLFEKQKSLEPETLTAHAQAWV